MPNPAEATECLSRFRKRSGVLSQWTGEVLPFVFATDLQPRAPKATLNKSTVSAPAR